MGRRPRKTVKPVPASVTAPAIIDFRDPATGGWRTGLLAKDGTKYGAVLTFSPVRLRRIPNGDMHRCERTRLNIARARVMLEDAAREDYGSLREAPKGVQRAFRNVREYSRRGRAA